MTRPPEVAHRLGRQSDIFIGVGVVAILVVMLVPLPAALLDLLITLNLSISLLVLLISMYIQNPLEFSVFPTFLLMITLFRLSITVASTRLILLHGNEGTTAAGQVIAAFGHFVVGGNYVVGAVVFLILVVIQFVVITKGAGRIAEVAARFTLDAMPGKQMAIDADLNAGLINEAQARARRQEIAREADFYGAMDGASKFVRGDAIAGVIITLVNILGGFAIGVLQLNLPLTDAAKTYTVLTIGDGLVTQIPALIVSTASGIVVTRAATATELGQAFTGQMLKHSRALAIAAGVLLALGLVPGLPKLPFFILAAVTGSIAYSDLKSQGAAAAAKAAEEGAQAAAPPAPEKVERLLALDPLELEVGYGLIPLVDAAQGGDLLERIRLLRRQFATDLGFVVPPIRIRDNLQLKPSQYAVKIRGLEVATGEVMLGHYLAMNPGTAQGALEGVETREPTFGLPAHWIPARAKEQAQLQGYTVVDPSAVIATHLTEVIRMQARELLSRQDVQALLDHLKQSQPAVVDGLIPGLLPLGAVHKVLQNLLGEGVSIRDLGTILETLADHAPATRDPNLLTEHARQALAKNICRHLVGSDGLLKVLSLAPGLEGILADGLTEGEGGLTYLGLEPRVAQRAIEAIAAAIERAQPLETAPVLLCAATLRPHLKRLTERYLPHLAVLSYNEIAPRVTIRSVGMVELGDAA
jgi:flagellar biosynthesis protein FlhA